MSRRGVGALGGLVVLVLAAGAYVAPSGMDEILPDIAPSRGSSQGSTAQDEDVDADALAGASSDLDALTIAELGHGDDYDRDLFGQRWADIDRNGCDQRNDALRAGAVEVTTKPGTHGCVVLEATIEDPYTGTTIDFVKGENTVDIDHVVPLSRAWQQGASIWPEERREEFANISGNLLAVDASANRSKGDRGPEEWMPDAGRCGYVIQWIDVKTEFELSVSVEEKSALEDELDECEGSL
ncbi:MAG: HNH endonuclease family protein [Brachybacterium tyrofermentans]